MTAPIEIYALCEPITGDVRYIGKAKNSALRFNQHLRDSAHRNSPIHRWLRDLIERGERPLLVVLETCAESEWPRRERDTIRQARANGVDILNVAAGGNQPFCSKEVLAANGRTSSIKRRSTPQKRRTLEVKRSLSAALKHGLLPEEIKAKMRLAASLKPEIFGAWAGV